MLKNRFFSLSVNLFLRRQKEIDAQKRATERRKREKQPVEREEREREKEGEEIQRDDERSGAH